MVYVKHFLLDLFNVNHLGKHGVTVPEIVKVCKGKHLTEKSYEGRYLIVGKINPHRILTVILAPKSGMGKGVYYPVSARPANRKEKKAYNQVFSTPKIKRGVV
jgi:uncharacterized DUF497 family protein